MGEYLAGWLRREVFVPLGMTATGFCPEPAARSSIPPTEEDTTFRHARIQGEVQDENAWVMKGVAGHAGLFSNVPDLLRFAGAVLSAGTSSRRQRGIVRGKRICLTGRLWRICAAARSGGEFARAGLGYALRELVLRQALCAAFDRAPRLQRLFALDRPGCRSCRGAADQPHLAGPAEPIDPRGAASFSRRSARGFVGWNAVLKAGSGQGGIFRTCAGLQIQ